MSEKVYGLHAVRALLRRHAERVQGVTIAEQRNDPRMTDLLHRMGLVQPS